MDMEITHGEPLPRVVDKCAANAVGNLSEQCGHKGVPKLSTGMDKTIHPFPTPLKNHNFMFLNDNQVFTPKLAGLIVIK
jgi:hypothetical protein